MNYVIDIVCLIIYGFVTTSLFFPLIYLILAFKGAFKNNFESWEFAMMIAWMIVSGVFFIFGFMTSKMDASPIEFAYKFGNIIGLLFPIVMWPVYFCTTSGAAAINRMRIFHIHKIINELGYGYIKNKNEPEIVRLNAVLDKLERNNKEIAMKRVSKKTKQIQNSIAKCNMRNLDVEL